MATFLIRHVTTYRYRQPVAFGEHRMMLRPRDGHDQRTRHAGIAILPTPRSLAWAEDAAGNLVGLARFGQRATELRIEATLEVEQEPVPVGAIAPYAESLPVSYGAEEMPDLARFIERQYPDPEHRLDLWVRRIRAECAGPDGADTWCFLTHLNRTIKAEFAYLRREEQGIQTPLETLHLGRGTCRDFAVLMAEAARAQGLAARFVSGYLHVREDEPATVLAGGSTHAWLQVYLPGSGWIDFDPTSGTIGSEGLIRVAAVRDPERATPLSGTFIGFPNDYIDMQVAVRVTRLGDAEAEPAPLRSYAVG